jgi:transposase-like protein
MGRVAPSVIAREQLQELLSGGLGRESNVVSALVETVTRLVVQELLEAEQADYLGGRGRYERRRADQLGSRNGYEPARVRTAEGAFDVAVPQVRGTEQPFRSSLMGFLNGNSEVLERLVCEMYARGLSTRDVEDAFRDATGQPLISKSGVSEITDRLWEDYQAFIARDLSEISVEYLFVDAIFESLRRHGAKEALLVAWCIASDGRKHLLHLAVGNKESQACWTESFGNMLHRGMRLPTTVTSDGAPGLINAITACFPASIRIRCWFHRLGNLRAKLPDEVAGEVMAHIYAVRRTDAGCGPGRGRPVYQYLPAGVSRSHRLLRRGPGRLAGHPPGTGAPPHPGPHHEPGRAQLRRRTPPHQGHPAIPRRKSRAQAGVRHHDPRRRPLVPSVDQRPRTPPAHPAAHRAGTRPTPSQPRSPQDQPTQRHRGMISRPPIYRAPRT